MARYAIIDADKNVINVVEWDGDTDNWSPPANTTVVEDPDTKAAIGGRHDRGKDFIPPTLPSPPVRPDPAVARRAQLADDLRALGFTVPPP